VQRLPERERRRLGGAHRTDPAVGGDADDREASTAPTMKSTAPQAVGMPRRCASTAPEVQIVSV